MGEGEGKGQEERGNRYSSKEAKGPKRERVTKMSGFYREEPLGEGRPSPWARKFRVEGEVCQPYPVTGRGYWENLAAWSSFDLLSRHHRLSPLSRL